MVLRFVVFRERSGALLSENNEGKPQPKNLRSEKKGKKKTNNTQTFKATTKRSHHQPNQTNSKESTRQETQRRNLILKKKQLPIDRPLAADMLRTQIGVTIGVTTGGPYKDHKRII